MKGGRPEQQLRNRSRMYTDRYETDFFYVGNHRSLLNTSGDMAAMDAWYRRGLPQEPNSIEKIFTLDLAGK